jgi:hypothetical protein
MKNSLFLRGFHMRENGYAATLKRIRFAKIRSLRCRTHRIHVCYIW